MCTAHLKELKKEAQYFSLVDLMFPPPLIPTQPTTLTDISGFECCITQDEKGVWFARDKTDDILPSQRSHVLKNIMRNANVIAICLNCRWGSCMSKENIGGKLTFVEFAKERAIYPLQPTVESCEHCICYASDSSS